MNVQVSLAGHPRVNRHGTYAIGFASIAAACDAALERRGIGRSRGLRGIIQMEERSDLARRARRTREGAQR